MDSGDWTGKCSPSHWGKLKMCTLYFSDVVDLTMQDPTWNVWAHGGKLFFLTRDFWKILPLILGTTGTQSFMHSWRTLHLTGNLDLCHSRRACDWQRSSMIPTSMHTCSFFSTSSCLSVSDMYLLTRKSILQSLLQSPPTHMSVSSVYPYLQASRAPKSLMIGWLNGRFWRQRTCRSKKSLLLDRTSQN